MQNGVAQRTAVRPILSRCLLLVPDFTAKPNGHHARYLLARIAQATQPHTMSEGRAANAVSEHDLTLHGNTQIRGNVRAGPYMSTRYLHDRHLTKRRLASWTHSSQKLQTRNNRTMKSERTTSGTLSETEIQRVCKRMKPSCTTRS